MSNRENNGPNNELASSARSAENLSAQKRRKPSMTQAIVVGPSQSVSPKQKSEERRGSFNANTSDDDDDDEDSVTRMTIQRSIHSNQSTQDAFSRVTRVSRHAALTTKQAVWDSNELSIEAAISAVDQWEATYTALRTIIVQSVQSIKGIYGAAKDGVGKLEHGLLIPVRDWILLPAFFGTERAVTETIQFLQSPAANQLAQQSLQVVKSVPVVGENILAPSLFFTTIAIQRTWDIIQYPIPSKEQVRNTVDWSLTGTKWAISVAAREIFLYCKRADANITRTLSHTQWKVLGSGPYATLDESNKSFVIDHLCERYFSQLTDIARYELAAHVKRHNPALYADLVLSGLLKQRGGDITENDVWLSYDPIYRSFPTILDERPFLLPRDNNNNNNYKENNNRLNNESQYSLSALWFRLPQVNGKQPSRDAPWVCFPKQEQYALEERYANIVRSRNVFIINENSDSSNDDDDNKDVTTNDDAKESDTSNELDNNDGDNVNNKPIQKENSSQTPRRGNNPPPTIAQWYLPNDTTDILVDQKRHAVTFSYICPRCRQRHPTQNPPLIQKTYGQICQTCILLQGNNQDGNNSLYDDNDNNEIFGPPPIGMIMRPIFWRFYGKGDEVRRSAWFIDTARNGLQPFDDEAQAILEDAYLFLRWMEYRKTIEPSLVQKDQDGETIDQSLLTVEVTCPDGTERLVQFSSLMRATAIQKGLGAAIALFKRRVYRGAWLRNKDVPTLTDEQMQHPISLQETIARATEESAATGIIKIPNESIRSILEPPSVDEQQIPLVNEADEFPLAAPPERLENEDMAKYLADEKDGKIDHLCLVVHGIGEMLRSIDLFGLSLPNLSSVCGSMRANHTEVQDAHFAQMYPGVDAASRASTGRVEYLPVEWHESFSILTQRRAPLVTKKDKPNVMMSDISLRTIPNMREFANDTLMDVLFFMSPEHHDVIINVVTHELNLVVDKFRNITGFSGPISVIGHSLGSIITWDILNNQNVDLKQGKEVTLRYVSSTGSLRSGNSSPKSQSEPSDTLDLNSIRVNEGFSGYPQLNFVVENFFLLGSPVPVFLMIRDQRKPLSDEFYLRGCGRVFNIFHPYDPVAYRIEPCIDPRNSEYEPKIIKHWNGGFRVQYRTRRLWRKIVETTFNTQRSVVEAFEQSMAAMGLLDATVDVNIDEDSGFENSEDQVICGVSTGRLNQGRRVDYMLQEREIENANEYVAALAAHSSYWTEKDLSLFIARQVYLSSLEHARAEAEVAEEEAWESISPDEMK